MIDDFVVDDDEVEAIDEQDGGAASGSDSDDGLFGMEREKKRKKKGLSRLIRNEGEILDDDELDLIADNNRSDDMFRANQAAKGITKMPKPRRVDDMDEDEDLVRNKCYVLLHPCYDVRLNSA